MIGLELASEARVVRAMAPQAAGITNVTGLLIDTAGYERLCFICVLGDGVATGGVSMKLQTGNKSDGSDMADVPGATTSLVVSDGLSTDFKLLILDIVKPTKRYAQPVVNRVTANHAIESVIALLYDARLTPVPQDFSVSTSVVAG